MSYQKIWQQNFKSVKKLLDFLQLPKSIYKNVLLDATFPLSLPIRLATKIKKKDIQDPILLQFLPLKKEIEKQKKSFSKNPLKENKFQKNRILKKYEKRLLLLTCNTCCMNCRFCFRRNFFINSPINFNKELLYIAKDTNIEEVILSGGDPLSLNNQQLKMLFSSLNKIDHLKRIRIHSRFFIGIPERLNDELLFIFASLKKQCYFVTHINHFQELDDDIINVFKKLQAIKIPVLCQSVLLKDVNDDIQILSRLYTALINNGIIPYYLHQLDKVFGASHFETTKITGKNLIKSLLSLVPGYGVPRYVQEIPYKKSKTLITP